MAEQQNRPARDTALAVSADATGSADNKKEGSLRDELVGAWRLVSCVERDIATSEIFLPMGETPEGFILYTPDGYMSAQLSSPGRAHFADGDMYRGTPDEYAAAGLGYLAYSGPYHVDEARQTVEHSMVVSGFPNWAGERQIRLVELDGDQLVLRTEAPSMFNGSLKHATVTWRRAPSNT
jgi:hypothetical protein